MTGRVLILGSTDVTHAVARAVLECSHDIAAIVGVGNQFVISYADKPVTNLRHVSYDDLASRHGIPLVSFTNYDALPDDLVAQSDLCLLAGWYHMVPARFRKRFARGCFGFHASILPALRGGAPLNWAILSGLQETGVSLIGLSDGVDNGPVAGCARFPIGDEESVASLVAKSQTASVSLVHKCLDGLLDGSLVPAAQKGTPTYCLQRIPEDGLIDWRMSADHLLRLVRALDKPYPGAYSFLKGKQIIIRRARAVSEPVILGAPGQIAFVGEYAQPLILTGDLPLEILAATDEAGNDMLPVLAKHSNQRLTCQ